MHLAAKASPVPNPQPRDPSQCYTGLAMEKFYEEFKVHGKDLVDKVKGFVHESNVRRIIIKDEKGHTFMEIPLSVAAVGMIAAPILAAVGAIAVLVANFTLVVERVKEEPPEKPAEPGS